ncbi:MAG: winged helix-turn-helix transcriptional regulator [Bryobacterales bacterium]|nr:winged helix-turn-helix transcriptional regulator [Bryobacterales bacterium]
MTPESQNVEWKRSWRDEHLKWICGFANAQGGVLEIGKNDHGEVVGVKGVLRLLEEIPGKVQSLLGIVADVNLKSESGKEYLEVVVDPHPNPISYRGEFHCRSGRTKQVLRGAALSRFLLARYGKTWDDVALPGVWLKDLDERALGRFRRKAVGSGRLPAEVLSEPVESLIENLNLRDREYLKRAAALLFHRSPGRFVPDAYVKIGCFRGSELLFQDLIQGDLFTQVDRTMDLLYTKYTRGLVSYDGIYRVETFPVPQEAMREAVTNAVIHRDYASPTTIQIRVSDDRIAIWNAAHLSPDWMAELLAEELSSRPHNPRIAYAFFRAGMIEAWGRGIRRIVDIGRAADTPVPTWRLESGGAGLWVRFPFSKTYQAADSAVRGNVAQGPPPDTAQNRRAIPQKTTQKVTRPTQKPARDRIVDCLRAEPGLTRKTLAERVGLSPDGVKYHLENLKAAGIIRRVGSDRAGHWEVLL